MSEKGSMSSVNERGIVAKPSEVAGFIEHVMHCNLQAVAEGRPQERLVPCIWGSAGISKTATVKQLEKVGLELKGERVYPKVIHIALAQIEEAGDITGLPVTDVDGKGRAVTRYAAPDWWPTLEMTEGGKRPVILLFDDFNRADPRILKAIMQLLQDYRSNVHELPDNCHIMLTGNPPSGDDGTEYMVNEIDKAILTRMVHITMKFDKVDWARWAQNSGIDNRVINFALTYPEQVNGEGSKRTNPRSLAQFSALIKGMSVDVGNEAQVSRLGMCARACLDDAVATSFEKFVVGDMQKLVEPEEILGDWDKAEKKLEALKKRAGGKDGESKVRTDLIGIIADRMYIYLMQDNLKLTEKNHKAFVSFIKRTDLLPSDLMYTLLRRIRRDAKTPQQNAMVKDLVSFGGKDIADLIMSIT